MTGHIAQYCPQGNTAGQDVRGGFQNGRGGPTGIGVGNQAAAQPAQQAEQAESQLSHDVVSKDPILAYLVLFFLLSCFPSSTVGQLPSMRT